MAPARAKPKTLAQEPASGPMDFLPSRPLPHLYFGFGQACLAAAFGVLAVAPDRVLGFYYQPRVFAVVHLVTLGWVTASILGSLYIVAPLALRLPLPARKPDYAAFLVFAVGVLGMTSHFWIDRPRGMLWAAPLVPLAIGLVAFRIGTGLPRAPLPAEVKVHILFALANVFLAAALGFLLGLNKVDPFIPLPGFPGVVAHAHLAGVGFATMMVMGAGYRLLPMFLPAAMPLGAWPWATALVTEVGVLGLVASAVFRGETDWPWAVLTAAGPGLFLTRVVWMLRHRKPAPPERARPDWAMGHVFSSLVCLAVAIGLGLVLALLPASDRTLALGKVYGLVGLVGFLAQIVLGVQQRLVPMVAWLWSFADGGHRDLPMSLHRTPSRPLQALGFALWSLGLPVLAVGLYEDDRRLVSAGGGALLAATVGHAANLAAVLRRSRERHPPPGPPSSGMRDRDLHV